MPVKRTQIRGIKDAKKSSKNSKDVKTGNKFRNGGTLKKKSVSVSNEPSYPSKEEFKNYAAKQGFNSDSTIYRHNPQNLRGVMAHNGVPADSIPSWSGSINRELSKIAANKRTNKYGNVINGTINDNGEINIKKMGGILKRKKTSSQPKSQPTYYDRHNAIYEGWMSDSKKANDTYGGISRENEMRKVNEQRQKMLKNLDAGFELSRSEKLKPKGPGVVKAKGSKLKSAANKFKCGGKIK